ncbi:MAG: tetratricopeptide repeat protein [Syntrophobacteraceae bacterium]|nr:tetratricopeptide repeat protein [Syntrophobacteraceae bacterium]
MALPKVRTGKQAAQAGPLDLSRAQRAQEWLEHNRNLLGGIVAGVLVVFLIVLGVQGYLSSQESRAEERYAQLLRQWPADFGAADDQAMEKLIPDLEQFIREHEGRRAAWLARLDLARVFYQLRRQEDALGQNRRVLDGAGDPSLKGMARYQAAVTLQAMGRSEEAITHWTAMKNELSLVSEREINWKLATLHTARQEYPKAIEHLEAALKAGGDYPTNQLIEDQLAGLRASAPQGS